MRITDVTKQLFTYLVGFRQRVAQGAVGDINTLRHELESVFHSMESIVSRHPKLVPEYRQVKYALTVLADEIVLTSAWPEAKNWKKYLMLECASLPR